MKVIKLRESQMMRLIESETAPNFNDGDIKEYPGSEVSTTTAVHDDDGNPKYGKQEDTDDILGDFLAMQNWWANAHNGARVMP